MRLKIIILFFCSAFITLPSASAVDTPNDLKLNSEGRMHIRMPIRISSYSGSWESYWSIQSCGICDKLADDCAWLLSQKEDIRRKWLRTRSGKE